MNDYQEILQFLKVDDGEKTAIETPVTEHGYSLQDDWQKTGNDLEEFRGLVDDMTKASRVFTVKAEDLELCSFVGPKMRKDGQPVVIYRRLSPDILKTFEDTGMLATGKDGFTQLALRPDNAALLEDEEKNSHIHFIVRGNDPAVPTHMYVSESGASQFLAKEGIAGGTDYHTLARDVHLASKLSKEARSFKLLGREIEHNGTRMVKIFGNGSIIYSSVPMDVLPRAVDLIKDSRVLGEMEVSYWFADQNFTEIRVEFPDAADSYTAAYGLPHRLIPGLRLCTSDTGASSVIVEPTYRIDDAFAIGEESVRKMHRGTVTAESVLEEVDANVLGKLKDFPEALIDRLGVSIGTDDLSKKSGRTANKKLVLKCMKAGMKELGIYKILGTARKKILIEKLRSEVDSGLRYTEYDLAITMMGLASRVHIDSRAVSTNLAKACGRAASIPYLELAMGMEDEDDDVFIDDPE